MAEREKVVRGLELCAYDPDPGQELKELRSCPECPYYRAGCSPQLIRDALALLQEQEARVMTLEELRDVGQVWEISAPPYLWLDKNRSIYNTISFWCAWRDIYEMIHGRHDKYTDENYGSEWRCWNAFPTPEQMRDTKWEVTENG
jgi:hypothetical protein